MTPADRAESRTARRSTSVIPEGTQTMTLGLTLRMVRSMTRRRKWRSIFSATSKFAITPSFIGRTARMPSGRPAEHPLGLEPDPHDVPGGLIHRRHRGLVQDDAFALDQHQGVRGAQVHGQLAGGAPGLPPGQGPTALGTFLGDDVGGGVDQLDGGSHVLDSREEMSITLQMSRAVCVSPGRRPPSVAGRSLGVLRRSEGGLVPQRAAGRAPPGAGARLQPRP